MMVMMKMMMVLMVVVVVVMEEEGEDSCRHSIGYDHALYQRNLCPYQHNWDDRYSPFLLF